LTRVARRPTSRLPIVTDGGASASRAALSEEFHSVFKTLAEPHGKLVPRNKWGVPSDAIGEMIMPKFVIEREIPGAGKLTAAELKTISRKSCGVLSSMGPSVQWVHSYVTGDKVYCIYHATDESLVRRHAELGGFPANKISQVFGIIDPSTAE
jgi:Protein of unknown function (DUF4242)